MKWLKTALFIGVALFSLKAVGVRADSVAAFGDIVEGPFKTDVFPSGKLWVEKINEAHKTLALILESTNKDGGRIRRRVDAYDDGGTGLTVDSVFSYPVRGKKHVVVLVSWGVNSRGVGTYGRLYHVFAYSRGANDEIVPNKEISNDDSLFGMYGYQEGEVIKFNYKDASSIKRYIKEVVDAR